MLKYPYISKDLWRKLKQYKTSIKCFKNLKTKSKSSNYIFMFTNFNLYVYTGRKYTRIYFRGLKLGNYLTFKK